VATIGDGTFFHGGIPALLNASHCRTNLTVIILDNHWASMTGMQPHVGSRDLSYAEEKHMIVVEEIVKAAGIPDVRRINPYQTKRMVEAMMEALSSPEIAVIISDAECAIQKKRKRKGGGGVLTVKSEKCVGIETCEHACIEVLGCPALGRAETGKAFIDPDLCTGCGLCHHACPYGAI
jgi:indolepyruvate ferredoxin oxidoreductase alpha subunit